MITDEELKKNDAQGLIPGPGETDAQFLKRCNYCLSLKSRLESSLLQEPPFEEKDRAIGEESAAVLDLTRRLFGISPAWVPIFYSNHKLSFWHGGCAWIFQEEEDSPKGALLQLRKNFRTKKRYLYLYDRDELAAHELAHVGRMAFDEPKFEELIASQASASWLRRYFAPLFQSSRESLLFVISLLLVAFVDAAWIVFPHEPLFVLGMWLKLLPLTILLIFYFRLRTRQKQWQAAQQNLEKILRKPAQSLAVLFRLTDSEIMEIAERAPSTLPAFLESKRGTELRWRLLFMEYLSI